MEPMDPREPPEPTDPTEPPEPPGRSEPMPPMEPMEPMEPMDERSFTAGMTLNDGRAMTVDVTGIDAQGLSYRSEQGPGVVPWAEVKAVMLATTDHMLESGGYLFSMAELVQQREEAGPTDALEMRRFGLELLREAAPRICPMGEVCGLRAQPLSPPPPPPGDDAGGG